MTHATECINLEKNQAECQEPDTKGHSLCDPMKCPEQANPQRQKEDQWLSGAGGGATGNDC